ncbi:histidine phosphatase family protein [Dactylosporangium sp. CA-233914]|uniref:histidine phosphatase family protein n=1 Tax=Dactylosporangium sp. CA-233914 TaxID=3239934 RepID=UPI003D8BC301
MTTLHLVRHGESEWNVARRLQGQTPYVPLTPRGHRQARATAEALRGTAARAVYTSDLLRARQTAEHIADVLDVPIRLRPDLRERCYGRLEGLPSADALWAAGDVDVHPGGGESLRELRQRIAAAIAGCLADAGDGALVIVSHGDTIRAALEWLGEPTPEIPGNGAVVSRRVAASEARHPGGQLKGVELA